MFLMPRLQQIFTLNTKTLFLIRRDHHFSDTRDIRFRIKGETEDLLKLYLEDFEIITVISLLQILIN